MQSYDIPLCKYKKAQQITLQIYSYRNSVMPVLMHSELVFFKKCRELKLVYNII
jgi:hypothetical protein